MVGLPVGNLIIGLNRNLNVARGAVGTLRDDVWLVTCVDFTPPTTRQDQFPTVQSGRPNEGVAFVRADSHDAP
jgi:hypothetical protein